MSSRTRLRALALLAALSALLVPAHAQRVANEVRPQEAFFGQVIRYVVQVQGTKSATCTPPEVDGLSFELEDQGVTNQSTQITIVNGRRQMRESADYAFVYRVTAAHPGRYAIPPPKVTVDGAELAGTRSTLLVEDPTNDDRAFLEFHAEPPAIVLGQDGRLVVDVFLKHLPPDLNRRDPLDVYDRPSSFSLFDQGTPPPVLTLPWITDPPQGLGKLDLESWVRSRQARRGFQLAGVRGGRFLQTGSVEDVEREDRSGETERYRRYRFELPVRGEVAGVHELPPATLEGSLVSPSGGRYVWRDAFARSKPLRFEVLEPPREGRPATFTGAVGDFTFGMEPPSPTLVRVGDPVYLTLVVRGQGFLKGVGFDLGAQLGDRFRVEQVGVTDSLPPGSERPPGFPDRPGQWRQWDYKVFPVSTEVDSIPELAFSWFVPERREYETATTAPVPITVQPAGAGDSDVVVGGGNRSSRREAELVATAALSANVTDLNLLADQSPHPLPWFTALVALPVVYVLLAFFVRRRRRLRDDPALLRRHRAAARAHARLREARAAGGADAVVRAHAALRGFVADLTDRDEEALTTEELAAFFEERGVDAELRAQVRRLGEAVEAAAYGGGAAGTGEGSLLDGLERLLRGSARTGAALLLAVGLFAAAAPAQDVQAFQEAQAAFDAGEFEAAAHAYERMLEGGYENGYVLYNLGNAWLRAGELGRAIAAYRRASLFLPNDANLEVNLRRALDARAQPLSPPEGRGVLDYVLFWRRNMPFRTELRLAVAVGLLAFALGTVRLLSRSRVPGLLGAAALATCASLLLATSAALDYADVTARDRAVVVEETALRTGPGETFEPRYEQPLGEGAELEVLARRQGWLRVLAGGEYEGWLPESAAVTW